MTADSMTNRPPVERGFAVLEDGRYRIRALVAQLRACPAVTGDSTGPELRRRHDLMLRLRRGFAGHESLTQRYVWPLARRHSPGSTRLVEDLVRLRVEIEEAMVKLDWSGDRDPAVNDHTGFILDALERHLLGEEGIVHQLDEVLDHDTLLGVGRRLARARRWAPTRSHPDLPARPWVARLITPVTAVVDRARDVMSGPGG